MNPQTNGFKKHLPAVQYLLWFRTSLGRPTPFAAVQKTD